MVRPILWIVIGALIGLVFIAKMDRSRLRKETDTLKEMVSQQDASLNKVIEENRKLKESLDKFSKDYELRIKIQDKLGCKPGEIIPAIPLDEYYTKVVAIIDGKIITGEAETIFFGTGVESDNLIQKPKESFNSDTEKRVYASFPNKCPLKVLSKVVTRWMKIPDNSFAYAGVQPINPNSPNNYIYVEKALGWDVGVYQVELFRGDTLEKIGQGKFEVKSSEPKPEEK